MDPFSLSVGALGLVESLAKLIKAYDTPNAKVYLDDILGELMILQNILAESMLMIEELHGDSPYSALIALERCQHLSKEMGYLMSRLHLDGSRTSKLKMSVRIVSHEDRLRRVCTSFKSAILLFRDIATDAMTHELLREVSQKDPATGIAEPKQRSSRPPSVASVPPPRISSDWAEDVPSRPKANAKTTTVRPSEKLSLFDATISYIVERPSSVSEDSQDAGTSACTCGTRRIGKWFPVRGKLDSGANADFISDSIIARAGLEQFVVQNTEAMEVKMFGATFSFDKSIKLSWQMRDEERSCTQDFWVAPNTEEFDLIIGEPWMLEHGYTMIDNTKSKRKPQFFGMLKIGRKRKEQRDREKDTAKRNREEALRTIGGLLPTALSSTGTPVLSPIDPKTGDDITSGRFSQQHPGSHSTSSGIHTTSLDPSTHNGNSSVSLPPSTNTSVASQQTPGPPPQSPSTIPITSSSNVRTAFGMSSDHASVLNGSTQVPRLPFQQQESRPVSLSSESPMASSSFGVKG